MSKLINIKENVLDYLSSRPDGKYIIVHFMNNKGIVPRDNLTDALFATSFKFETYFKGILSEKDHMGVVHSTDISKKHGISKIVYSLVCQDGILTNKKENNFDYTALKSCIDFMFRTVKLNLGGTFHFTKEGDGWGEVENIIHIMCLKHDLRVYIHEPF